MTPPSIAILKSLIDRLLELFQSLSLVDQGFRLRLHAAPQGLNPRIAPGSILGKRDLDLPPRTSPPSKLDPEPFEVHSKG